MESVLLSNVGGPLPRRSVTSLGSGAHELLEGDLTAGEVAHRFHVRDRHAVRFPLRDRRIGNADMHGESLGSAPLVLKPSIQVHALILGVAKSDCQGQPKQNPFRMDFSMANARRRRFIAYFEKKYKGRRADFRRDTKLTNGRISQLFDERQPFGETAARNLARKLHLDDDFFEKDDPATTDVDALDLLARIKRLSSVEREQLRLMIQVVKGPDAAPPERDSSRPAEGLLGGLAGLGGVADESADPKMKKKGGQHGG